MTKKIDIDKRIEFERAGFEAQLERCCKAYSKTREEMLMALIDGTADDFQDDPKYAKTWMDGDTFDLKNWAEGLRASLYVKRWNT